MRWMSAGGIALVTAGCASVNSTTPLATVIQDGLVYYLPRRDLLVTVTVTDKVITKLEVAAGPAYADLAQPFVLQHQASLIAQNKLDVTVSAGGLLSSTTATTTPQLVAALEAAAQSAKAISAAPTPLPMIVAPEGEKCTAAGVHAFVKQFPMAAMDEQKAWREGTLTWRVCGGDVTVIVKRLWDWGDTGVKLGSNAAAAGERWQGVYYRQNLPYLVSATSKAGVNEAKIVFSPSASRLRFLPIGRTLFARSEAVIGFDEGVPKTWVQDTEGEIPELVKLPAAILKAYFAAVGALFTGRSSNDTAEATAIKASLQLEIIRAKFQACLDAARANDEKLITDLGCVAK